MMKTGYGLSLALGCTVVVGCFDPADPPAATPTDGNTSGPDTGDETNPVPTGNGVDTDDPDPGTSTVADPTTGPDPDSTTGPTVDCDGDGPDPACPSAAPYCVEGTCADCTGLADGQCMAFDPTAPVCDAEVGECTACTEHEQCITGACRFATGECFAQSNRLWVDNTFGGCAGGTGDEANPFCTVETALSVLDSQPGTEPWAVFVAGSPNPYLGTVDPNNDRPVAIIGPSAGLSATLSGENGFAVDSWAQSPETYLHRVIIDTNSAGTAIRCATGTVYITDGSIVGGEPGADVTGCSLRLRRTLVSPGGWGIAVGPSGELFTEDTIFEQSSGALMLQGTAVLRRTVLHNHFVEGGIRVEGGDLTLVNGMLYDNEYINDGIRVTQMGTAEIVHSTIIGALSCNNNAGNISVRNSIVLGRQSEAGLDCSAATVDTSVINTGLGQGSGNVPADFDDLPAIFVDATPFGGDWHVLPGSIPDGVAVHQAGDPLQDIDRDPRPTMAGASDYAGADVP